MGCKGKRGLPWARCADAPHEPAPAADWVLVPRPGSATPVPRHAIRGPAAILTGKTNASTPADDSPVIQQDLALMQQARGIDLTSVEARHASRDRLQALFIRLQKVIQPPLTLEIGAHAANFSQKMSRMGIEAHAFEASPHIHANFVQALAEKAPDLHYHPLAVSDVDGEVDFEVKETHRSTPLKKTARTNSLLRRADPGFTYDSIKVGSVRLESFLRDRGLLGRDFSAWVDVEGAFGKVSAGCGAVLRHCLSLIVEVEELAFWQDQMLVREVMRFLHGQGLVPVARDFEGQHQYNLLYLRPDVLERPAVRAELAAYFSGG